MALDKTTLAVVIFLFGVTTGSIQLPNFQRAQSHQEVVRIEHHVVRLGSNKNETAMAALPLPPDPMPAIGHLHKRAQEFMIPSNVRNNQ